MQLYRLEHVNIRTANLPAMIDWYCSVLGLKNGDRPAFDVPGAWLYLGDMPIVHLVEAASMPEGRDPKLEHFALSAQGLTDLIGRLDTHQIPHHEVRVPDAGLIQVNFADPDGNHIHVDFSLEEANAAGL